MNLQHEQKLSMDELMERNRPASAMQSTAPTAEPSITVLCPVPVELEKLTRQLEQLENRCTWQEKYLKELSETRYSYPTRTQMEELLKSVQHLEEMTEQAGKKKEKRFSLPRFRPPRLYLPEWEWPTVLTVAWMLAALFLLWFSSVDGWSKLSLVLR